MPPKRKRGGWDDPDTILSMELILLKDKLSTMAAQGPHRMFPAYLAYGNHRPGPGTHGPQQSAASGSTQSEVLSIVVGKEAKWFTWHRTLLKTHSPYLLAKVQEESINKSRPAFAPVWVIEDADIAHFDILNDYLYPLKPQTPNDFGQILYVIKNYDAARTYRFEQLHNVVMDSVFVLFANIEDWHISTITGMLLQVDEIDAGHALDDAPRNSFRDFLKEYLAYYLRKKPDELAFLSEFDRENFDDLFERTPLIQDVMLLRHGTCADPTKRKPCYFHWHANTPECPV